MKKIIAIILLFIGVETYAQKTSLTIAGKDYPAVSFVFTSYVSYGDARLFPDKDINLKIAKTEKGGLLEIHVDLESDKDLCDYFHKCGISGDISMELANGETIVCKDKGINDFMEGNATAVYELSLADMDILRKNNIEILRFHMRTFSKKGDYIAANFHHTISNTPDEFTRKKERVTITKVHKLVRQLK